MRVILCKYMNKKHYLQANEVFGCYIYKTVLQSYNYFKTEKHKEKCQSHFQNMKLPTACQPWMFTYNFKHFMLDGSIV
jgi:hypothetical protein